MPNSKILYLTESTFDFSTIQPTSTLLTKPAIELEPGLYHTSLGDMTVDQIIKISEHFDDIKFEPSGFDINSTVYQESLILYRYLNRAKLTNQAPVNFAIHAGMYDRTDQPTLWVFGCSHSHGVGLRSSEEPYGKHLARAFGLPLKLITKPGSSLSWSYRHLFNSVIEPRDTVIWQLTTRNRLSQFNGNQVEEILLTSTKNRSLLDIYDERQTYFLQLSQLNTGVQYLRKLGCRFAITSIVNFDADRDLVAEYVKYPEYCYHNGCHLDMGTDGIHAGPLSHKAIAQRLLNHIQLLNA